MQKIQLTPAHTTAKLKNSWVHDVDLSLIAERVGTPVFVYSETQLRKNVARVQDSARTVGLGGRVELFVPFFPNSNPHLLEPLQELNVGLLLQVPGEYEILQRFGFDRFIISPGHVADAEIDFWAGTGYPTFLSSLDELTHALRTGAPSISVRIDSLDSGKPGIKFGELDQVVQLLRHHDRDLECFEVYCGSGNSREEMSNMIETMFTIFTKYFPRAASINFAGGHGFMYESWEESEKHFDWATYFGVLREIADRMQVPERVKFLFEPARDVLADTGVLLLSVERNVIKNPISNIVVTDGTRMLMPSAQLRDRHHNVLFLDASMREIVPADSLEGVHSMIRGRTILRHDYVLPGEYFTPDAVDGSSHLLIFDVGAYCATQHMEFLNAPPAAEVIVDRDGEAHLVTARGSDQDKWRHLLDVKKQLSA
jgi:diaminopimelate decarboxylase